MVRRRPGDLEAPEPRCPAGALPDDLRLGPHWALVKGLEVPGSPVITCAAVGEQGTVLIGAVGVAGLLAARSGHLYCGDVSLELVIAELAAARKALAGDLPPAMGDDLASVHALLIVPEAQATFTHHDVIVTSAEQAATALFSLPVVHAPEEVRWAKSVLRDREAQASPPNPDKALSAVQVAPRVRARARRPWRMGRWSARPMRRFVTGAGAVAAVALAIWQLQSGSGGAPPPAPLATAASGPAATTGVSAPTEALAYQGQRPGDVLATSTGVAQISGVRVTLGDPVVVPALGHMLLCVPVSVDNRGIAAAMTGAVTWALHSPTGVVEHPASMATNEVVSQGHLFPGKDVTGRLCFKEPGQGGVYVVTFSPHPRSATRSRAVWLVHLPRRARLGK